MYMNDLLGASSLSQWKNERETAARILSFFGSTCSSSKLHVVQLILGRPKKHTYESSSAKKYYYENISI